MSYPGVQCYKKVTSTKVPLDGNGFSLVFCHSMPAILGVVVGVVHCVLCPSSLGIIDQHAASCLRKDLLLNNLYAPPPLDALV
jgi:hypothetical protein